jgi:hypothetical protein
MTVAYADAVRRALDAWLESIANVANETGSEAIDNARHEDVNIKTAKLFDQVAVTGLLYCIAESNGLGQTTDLWEGEVLSDRDLGDGTD